MRSPLLEASYAVDFSGCRKTQRFCRLRRQTAFRVPLERSIIHSKESDRFCDNYPSTEAGQLQSARPKRRWRSSIGWKVGTTRIAGDFLVRVTAHRSTTKRRDDAPGAHGCLTCRLIELIGAFQGCHGSGPPRRRSWSLLCVRFSLGLSKTKRFCRLRRQLFSVPLKRSIIHSKESDRFCDNYPFTEAGQVQRRQHQKRITDPSNDCERTKLPPYTGNETSRLMSHPSNATTAMAKIVVLTSMATLIVSNCRLNSGASARRS